MTVGVAPPGTTVGAAADKLVTFMQRISSAILSLKTEDGHAAFGPFSLDTGSRPALMLSRACWTKQPPLAISDVHGDEGEFMSVDAVRLAHHTLQKVPALEPRHEGGLVASDKIGGVIGAALLTRFIVIYDPPNNSVWLTPSQTNPPR